MSLHDRVAMLVPDKNFLNNFKGHLAEAIDAVKGKEFTFVYARPASAMMKSPDDVSPRIESLILDTVENCEGLERLIILAIGLDSEVDEIGSAQERYSRSLIYRALTRAQLFAVAVNESVPNGHFAYLARVTLQDKFVIHSPKSAAPLFRNGPCKFWFLSAETILSSKWERLPRMQDLRNRGLIKLLPYDLKKAVRGEYIEEFVSVSHRWETKDQPVRHPGSNLRPHSIAARAAFDYVLIVES